MFNVSFGIKDLDRLVSEVKMTGGVISILSSPESGYEIISKAVLMANDPYNKVALIAKETKVEFVEAVKNFNLGNIKDVEIIDIGEMISKTYMQSMSTIAQIFASQKLEDFQKLLTKTEGISEQSTLAVVIEKIYDRKRSKIFIDFLDFLVEENNFERIFSFLNSIVSQAKHNHNFYILPLEVGLYPQLEKKLISNSDIVFKLYSEKARGKQRVNIIETIKIKNYPHIRFTGVYSIVPREGILIERIEKI